MKKGRAGTMTHDYKRNGTTTLFAALNVLDGSVIGQCMQRHRHQEFIRFLNRIERDVPAGKLIHVVLDNYATHKHPKVRAWLERHQRWTFHYTPLASWLNAVEGFFAKLTRRRLQRGVFHSLVYLQARDHPLPHRAQSSAQALRLDRRARGNPRQGQTRASSVRDDPLGLFLAVPLFAKFKIVYDRVKPRSRVVKLLVLSRPETVVRPPSAFYSAAAQILLYQRRERSKPARLARRRRSISHFTRFLISSLRQLTVAPVS